MPTKSQRKKKANREISQKDKIKAVMKSYIDSKIFILLDTFADFGATIEDFVGGVEEALKEALDDHITASKVGLKAANAAIKRKK